MAVRRKPDFKATTPPGRSATGPDPDLKIRINLANMSVAEDGGGKSPPPPIRTMCTRSMTRKRAEMSQSPPLKLKLCLAQSAEPKRRPVKPRRRQQRLDWDDFDVELNNPPTGSPTTDPDDQRRCRVSLKLTSRKKRPKRLLRQLSHYDHTITVPVDIDHADLLSSTKCKWTNLQQFPNLL